MRAVINLDRSPGIVLAGCVALVANTAQAVDWDTSASVAPSVTYTDNVCLTKDNKQDDWIGTLTPTGSIRGKGRNSKLTLTGSLQLNTLTNSALNHQGCEGNYDDRDQFSPRLAGVFNTVLVEDWLDLDVAARADQDEVSPFASGGDDPYDRTGNSNTFYRYSISPTAHHRFKDVAKANVKYTWDQQFNSDDRVTDSDRHSVAAIVENASPSRWSRALEGRYTHVEYEENSFGLARDDTELSSAAVRLGYRYSRRWEVNGYYGEEWNEFESTLNGDKDGTVWDVGMKWTPSPRTSVSAGWGERFFGNTPRVQATHRYRRSEFLAAYRKEITFERDIRSGNLDGWGDFNDLGNPLGSGVPENQLNDASIRSNGPILDERYALAWNFTGRGFLLSLRGNYSEQTRSEDGFQSAFKNVDLTFSPDLWADYSVTGLISWNEDEPEGFVQDDPGFNFGDGSFEGWTYGVTVGRAISQRMQASVAYTYTDQDSDTDFNEYQENRITATLGISL